MLPPFSELRRVTLATIRTWRRDDWRLLAGTMAYYSALGFAPLLILALTAMGMIWGEGAAHDRLVAAARELSNDELARRLAAVLRDAAKPMSGLLALGVALVALGFGGSRAMSHLALALERIWTGGAPPLRRGWRARMRAIRLSAVVLLWLFLVVGVGTGIGSFGRSLVRLGALPGLVPLVNLGTSLLLVGLSVMLLYRLLPAQHPPWRTLWPGTLLTTVCYVILVEAVSLYLRFSFGAPSVAIAGGIIIYLVFAHAMAQIFLIGAVFNAELAGRPDAGATTLTGTATADAGETPEPATSASPPPPPSNGI